MQEFQISFCFDLNLIKNIIIVDVMTTFQDSKVIPGNMRGAL